MPQATVAVQAKRLPLKPNSFIPNPDTMKTRLSLLLGLGMLLVSFASCVKDQVDIQSYTEEEYAVLSQYLDLPREVVNYANPELPPHLRSSGFGGTTITNHGATLGRVLFYDTHLSADNSRSCASCHHQDKAMADARALSEGVNGNKTDRNALAIGNVRFYYFDRGFFWDERASSVEEQVRQTVSNHKEMGVDFDLLPQKLEGLPYYEILFKKAFGDSQITSDRIASALAQYVRSIISGHSKLDYAIEHDLGNNFWRIEQARLPSLTTLEQRGKDLYFAHCSSCHGNIIFLGLATANNGLDIEYADKGVGALTGNPSQFGLFKVPFLRNIALTAPYMHDGRFQTLEEVVEHYNSGIQPHPNLSPQLRNADGTPKRLNLSDEDKQALVAFLETLTDDSFLTDPAYADPFK